MPETAHPWHTLCSPVRIPTPPSIASVHALLQVRHTIPLLQVRHTIPQPTMQAQMGPVGAAALAGNISSGGQARCPHSSRGGVRGHVVTLRRLRASASIVHDPHTAFIYLRRSRAPERQHLLAATRTGTPPCTCASGAEAMCAHAHDGTDERVHARAWEHKLMHV